MPQLKSGAFIWLALTVCLLLMGQTARAENETSDVQWVIQEPGGPYHDGEAVNAPQSGWLALVEEDGQWSLKETDISVERAADDILDAPGGAPTGLVISSAKYPKALVLLKHPAIKPGPVNTPPQPLWQLLSPHSRLPDTRPQRLVHSFDLNGRTYWLELFASDFGDGGDEYIPDKLFIYTTKPENPTIDFSSLKTGPDWQLNAKVNKVWAGDLDSDGQPDFITWIAGYNHLGVCLYLSSLPKDAAPGALPGQASCHIGTGC